MTINQLNLFNNVQKAQQTSEPNGKKLDGFC